VNSKQFARYLERDQGCVHCGTYVAAVPHHRQNRGMGGSKKRDNPANILVLCAEVNGLLESDATWAVRAREYGWKLRPWDDPLYVPVFDSRSLTWWRLDDDFGRVSVEWEDYPF
jgi:hypothetical protein